MASFDVVLRTRASLHSDGDPSEFISTYTGTIVSYDETGEEKKVGRVSALRVHAGLAHNAGVPLFEVCDAHSHELQLLHTLLYEPDAYHFRDPVLARFDAAEPDLLLLDYVVLAPRWRKLRLGLLAVRKVLDLLGGGCGLAVSLIAPLRPDAAELVCVPPPWLPTHDGKQERADATVRLRRYFRLMGFTRLGRTPYYALALNQVQPTATELLGVGPRNEPG